MTDSGSDKEWTFVDSKGDEERHSDSSGSSSDFVNLDDDSTVSYHHQKSGPRPEPSADIELATFTDGQLSGTSDTDLIGSIIPSGSGSGEPETVEQDVESTGTDLIDSLENSIEEEEDPLSSEPEILDEQVMSALTCPGGVSNAKAAEDVLEQSVSTEVSEQPTPEGSTDSTVTTTDSAQSSGATLGWEENQWFWDDEVIPPEIPPNELPDENDSGDEEHGVNSSQSSSGIEELAMPEEEEEHGTGRLMNSCENGRQIIKLPLPSVEMLKKEEKISKSSDSESDLSDIVKIDHAPADVASTSHSQPRLCVRPVDLMQVSASSSSSGNSSLSSRFHFVHPLPRKHRYIYPRDEDGDIDDRCESDISGVVPDDSDPDLSSISYSLDQLEIMEGDVIRSYKHRPNSTLNTLLSILALLTLFTTIGVGIGHYLGTSREVMLRNQQSVRIKEIQDEYLKCLRNQELLEAQVTITDAEKIAAVTAVWKQKYEELIIEKVELEQTMKQLQKNMEKDLHEAKNKLQANHDEAVLLVNDINTLHQQYEEEQNSEETNPETSNPGLDDQLREFEEMKMRLNEEEAKFNRHIHVTEAQLSLQENKLLAREAVIREKEEELRKKHDKLEEEEAKIEKEKTRIQREEAKIQGEKASIEKEKIFIQRNVTTIKEQQASVQEQQARIQEEQVRIQEEKARIQEVQARLAVEKAELKNERDRLEEQQKLEEAKLKQSFAEFKELQQKANMLSTENDELRHQVALLRYSSHHHKHQPEEVQMEAEKDKHTHSQQLDSMSADRKNDVKSTESTKADHKAPGKRSAKSPASSEPKDHVGTGSPRVNASSDWNPDKEWFPVMWTYFSILMPDMDLSRLPGFMSRSQTDKPLAVQIQFIQNLTSSVRCTENVKQKLNKLRAMLRSIKTYPDVDSTVFDVITEMKEIFLSEMDSFRKYKKLEELQKNNKENRKKAKESTDKSTPALKYHEFINKTRECVSQLSDKIKKTWNQVKNITGDFLKKNKVLKEFGDSVSKSMKQVSKSMNAKWKKAKKHLMKKGFILDLFGRKDDRTKKQANAGKRRHEKVVKMDQTYSRRHIDLETLDKKQFKKSEGHQNKQSSNAEYEKYEEYWQQAEFEPDDFLQEGFFEGNNRQWHKHQRKARQLHGRLQRLTDDIFLAMDDDDIEDMYEDFEDFQEDIDGQDQPDQLMTWLTCQIRWWKSRLYRKHSNEDLVKGCGRQLMQWQLRALCKPCGPASRRCRRRQSGANGSIEGPFCHYYQTVILAEQGGHGAGRGQGFDGGASPKVISVGLDSEARHVDGQLDTDYGCLRYSLSLDADSDPQPAAVPDDGDDSNSNSSSSSSGGGGGGSAEHGGAVEPSARWLFERAEDREAYHHNGLWMFRRGARRHFERTKPWYYRRAEHRADRRVSSERATRPDPGTAQRVSSDRGPRRRHG